MSILKTFSGISCELLEAPKNGDIAFSQGTLFGSIATYTCTTPYQLVGVATRVCQATGEWSGEIPVCESEFPHLCRKFWISESLGTSIIWTPLGQKEVPDLRISYDVMIIILTHIIAILCDELESPDNGVVDVPSRLPGSTATYDCLEGYDLVGSRTRSCQNNGFWTGVDPFCQRKI